MKKVKKAVIPAAGLGTRFLPATKTIPKELFPIVDKPILLHVIEEAVDAGLEEVVIIAGRNKTEIEDFFDSSYELEDRLQQLGKTQLLEKISYIKDLVTVISIRQKEALGLGHAVLCAEPVVGNDPFVVMLGDEIAYLHNGPNPTAGLIKSFEQLEYSCTSVIPVEASEVSKYGIVSLSDPNKPVDASAFAINGVVEKPKKEDSPSTWALPGRYVFTHEIFEHIRSTNQDQNKEIQLASAMDTLAKAERLYALHVPYRRFDAGDKLGYLKANVEFALDHPELAQEFKAYLMEVTKSL